MNYKSIVEASQKRREHRVNRAGARPALFQGVRLFAGRCSAAGKGCQQVTGVLVSQGLTALRFQVYQDPLGRKKPIPTAPPSKATITIWPTRGKPSSTQVQVMLSP